LYDSGVAGLKGLRRFPVTDFGNYLVFYLPRRDGIEVIRVIHGARDIEVLLGQQTNVWAETGPGQFTSPFPLN